MVSAVLSGLPAAWPVLAAQGASRSPRGKALVAYFSRSGNTRVIAGQIQRARNAALVEIQPAQPYPDDYQETVEQARRERARGYRPPLNAGLPDLGGFDTIYLGFPIWGGSLPPVIRSFLAARDFRGKTIIPFITHGGYGIGNSLTVLAEDAPGARLLDRKLVMQADQEKRTLEEVTRWMGALRAT